MACVLREMEQAESQNRKKVYMICTLEWDRRYIDFLESLKGSLEYVVYPVIPDSWQGSEYEAELRKQEACGGVLLQSSECTGLDGTSTVFPVVPRDLIVKSALCISDTFETKWITACIEAGSEVIFLSTGLDKLSGKESKAYANQISSYYRTVISYGLKIGGLKTAAKPAAACSLKQSGKKRVITASDVKEYASNGVLDLGADDIITDLAKDEAEALNIVIRY